MFNITPVFSGEAEVKMLPRRSRISEFKTNRTYLRLLPFWSPHNSKHRFCIRYMFKCFAS